MLRKMSDVVLCTPTAYIISRFDGLVDSELLKRATIQIYLVYRKIATEIAVRVVRGVSPQPWYNFRHRFTFVHLRISTFHDLLEMAIYRIIDIAILI
jgi:hypothetical protein